MGSKQITLSKKDLKELNEKIREIFGKEEFFDKKDSVVMVDDKFVMRNKELCFFYKEGLLVPSLKLLLKENFLKSIVVDMGAVKFVVGGADIMRPGIKEIDARISKDEIIAVVDINNKKPIAVGIALQSAQEMSASVSGKSVKNIHRVGDEFWAFSAA